MLLTTIHTAVYRSESFVVPCKVYLFLSVFSIIEKCCRFEKQ